jgi:hypothetical protein
MEPRAWNVELVVASDVDTRNAVYQFRLGLAAERGTAVDVLPGAYLLRNAIGLQDLLDPCAIVAAAIDRSSNAIVGAARTNHLREGSIPVYPELYELRTLSATTWNASSVTTCWTMAPAFACAKAVTQDHPAMRLAWTLYDIALQQRICHDFLDCSDEDVRFFARLGYRLVREIQHPVRGRSNLMRLDIYDWSYLAEIESPFLALARGVA